MARLGLSKSSLTHQTRQLRTFRRFLPALDLKRRQLMAERAQALAERDRTREAIADARQGVGRRLPMLAGRSLELGGLARLSAVRLGRENRLGTWLPVLAEAAVEVQDGRFLSRPHWVDTLIDELRTMLQLQARLAVEERRLALLEEAVRKIAQRVNLFDKVLIPRAERNIEIIRIALSDAERAAVVRAKIAKAKRRREGLA